MSAYNSKPEVYYQTIIDNEYMHIHAQFTGMCRAGKHKVGKKMNPTLNRIGKFTHTYIGTQIWMSHLPQY